MSENQFNDAFWSQWLEKYKSLKCLWHPSAESATSEERLHAWKELIGMAKEVDMRADANYIKERLRHFIFTYKLEAKKVKVAESNDIVYKPQHYSYKVFKSIFEEHEMYQCNEEEEEYFDDEISQSNENTQTKRTKLQSENKYVMIERKFWRYVIEKFVSFKCLWDHKNKKMYKKSEQEEAYKELLKIVKTRYSFADLDYVKSRINNFRNSFRRQQKQLLIAQEKGLDFKPSLFYYDLFVPIYDGEDCKNDMITEQITDNLETVLKIPENEPTQLVQDQEKDLSTVYSFPETKLWCKVIKKYVSFKYLWDSENQKLYTQSQRLEAWDTLLRMLKTCYPNADIDFVKKRVSYFRCAYTRECKKIAKAKTEGEKYIPKLFCFDLLTPLYNKDNNDISSSDDMNDDEVVTDDKPRDNKVLKTEEVWSEVIRKFVSFKCLWDRKNQKWYTQQQRLKAWKALSDMIRPFIPEANINYMKRRFNSIRASFRRERRKVAKAKEEGNEYRPNLYYFDLLTPLYDKLYNDLHDNEAHTLDNAKNITETNAEDFAPCENSYSMDGYNEELEETTKHWNEGNIATVATSSENKASNQSYTNEIDYESADDSQSEVEMKIQRAESDKRSERKRDFAGCSYNTELWSKFLKKYISFKCLWDHKNNKLYTKESRYHAWQKLVKFVRSYYPAADLAYVKSRINSLRTSFKREHNKVLAAKESGIERTPTIFHYDLLLPLYEENVAFIENSSDESISDDDGDRDYADDDDVIDLEIQNTQVKTVSQKNLLIRKELQRKGFICGPFETENLSSHQKIWLKAIRKYVTFKCLWDQKNCDYYKEYERETAWHELLHIVRTVINEVDLGMLKQRFRSFRLNYRRNYQKAKEARQIGVHYETSLYFFNAMSPIYQEGFPILPTESDDESAELNFNPTHTTYFPDDDEVEDSAENQQTDETDESTLFSNIEEYQFKAENVSVDDKCETDDDLKETKCSEDYFSDAKTSNINEENPLQIPSKNPTTSLFPKHPKCNRKRIRSKENIDDAHTASESDDSEDEAGHFNTFQKRITQHLEAMDVDQYLYAEKLISDVCVYGRLKKLKIDSNIKLKM